MAATVFGTLANLLSHLLDGSTKYATPVVAGVEGPDGNVRAQQGTNDGAALVSVSGTASVTGDELSSIAETTHAVAVTATTYATPLKWIHNYGAAGICKIKSSSGDTAQTIYLAQGQTLSNAEIVAVSDIGAGVTLTGGY